MQIQVITQICSTRHSKWWIHLVREWPRQNCWDKLKLFLLPIELDSLYSRCYVPQQTTAHNSSSGPVTDPWAIEQANNTEHMTVSPAVHMMLDQWGIVSCEFSYFYGRKVILLICWAHCVARMLWTAILDLVVYVSRLGDKLTGLRFTWFPSYAVHIR